MNEREIFSAARGIADNQDREAYLERACGGDLALKERIQGLLRSADVASCFLESPVHALVGLPAELDRTEPSNVARRGDGDTAAVSPPPQAPVDSEVRKERIGPYRLIEQIGQGGMGTVFMAEQKQPVRRTVALKVIKRGMDSEQVVARFEAERQALALMSHPNIARVLDAGITEDGRPYFAMDLVRGIPITDYCDQHRLSRRERLELFVNVCQAVQHAHQKGVIHRDLKPSNILVELHDVSHVPKVIDFGVAKATSQQLTERTLVTHFSQMIGTPLYMSPEQAEFSGLDVDTRSDIYSLGVLLYELITGSTPFNRELFKEASWDEMRRIIREEEPLRPSQYISTLKAENASTIAERQRLDVPTLRGDTETEIDWIVMKALEKDRARRYETSIAFAQDVERYLRDECVLACPPSLGYRIRKYARKHRAMLTSVTLVAASLVFGMGFSLWKYAGERAARRDADAQRSLAQQQAARAEHSFQQARKTVEQYLTRVSDDILLKQPGMQGLRKELLELARAHYQDFVEQRSEDPDVKKDLARAYSGIAEITQMIGSQEEAFSTYLQAIKIRKQLMKVGPQDASNEYQLLRAYLRVSDIYGNTGKLDSARDAIELALALAKSLVGRHPSNVAYQIALSAVHGQRANLLFENGDSRRAVEAYREAIASIKPDDPENKNTHANNSLADLHRKLGTALVAEGDRKSAIECVERAVVLRGQVVHEDPANQRRRYSLSEDRMALASLWSGVGQYERAGQAIADSLKELELLVQENPGVTDYQSALARAYGLAAGNRQHLGFHEDAIERYQQAAIMQERLVATHPSVTRFSTGLIITYGNLGASEHALRRFAAARKWNQRALDQCQLLAKSNPEVLEFKHRLSRAYNYLGASEAELHNYEQAMAAYEQATQILEELSAMDPQNVRYGIEYGGICCNTGISLAGRNQPRAALDWFAKAIQRLDSVLKVDERNATARRFLANSHQARAQALEKLGEYAESAQSFRVTRQMWEQIVAGAPTQTNHLKLAFAQRNLWLAYEKLGELDEALECSRKALAIHRTLVENYTANLRYSRLLGGHHCNTGHLFMKRGDPEQALRCYEQAVATLQPLMTTTENNGAGANLRNSYFGLAQAYTGLARFEEAFSSWERVLKLSPPADYPYFAMLRARTYAKSGAPGQAIREANRVLETPDLTGDVLFAAARVFAVLSATAEREEVPPSREQIELSEGYAQQAVQLLMRASDSGWFRNPVNATELRQERDFDHLRSREDFELLVLEL